MWTIFLKVFIEFVTIFLLFYVLIFWPWGMWNLSSSIGDWNGILWVGRWSLNQWTAREVPADVFLNHHVFANGWSRGFLNKRLGTQPHWSETRLPVKSQREKWSGLLLLAVWWTRFSAGSFCYKQWHAQRVGVRGTKMVGVVYSGGERYLSPPPFRNAGVWW